MLRTLRFPVVNPAPDHRNVAMTFETMAVPPTHAQVTAVCGILFDDARLLAVQHAERGWELPGGARRVGETFHQTLARTTWEEAGVLVGNSRLIGALRTDDQDTGNAPSFVVVLVGDVGEVVPFGDSFDATDRAFVTSAELPDMIAEWNMLMDEVLAYAHAAHRPIPVETITSIAYAVA